MGAVAEVSESTFEQEVLKSGLPVLVDFYATWCGPCKAVAPIVEELAAEYAGKLKIVKVDIDEAQETTTNLGIMSVPTLMIFREGKEVGRIVGAVPKRTLVDQLQRALG